jgi:type III restriction enzyme
MSQTFFQQPILNSPYAYPARHWELDADGQPTGQIADRRRRAEFITAVPKPKKRKAKSEQEALVFDEGAGISTAGQAYDPTPVINELRAQIDQWRALPRSAWQVTPETARLLEHWRHHEFAGFRPFFCQVEAVEAAIWLTEVAPKIGSRGSASSTMSPMRTGRPIPG